MKKTAQEKRIKAIIGSSQEFDLREAVALFYSHLSESLDEESTNYQLLDDFGHFMLNYR